MPKTYDYSAPQVGQLVYEHYSPRKAGKIVEVVGRSTQWHGAGPCPFFRVKVKWAKDGAITEALSGNLVGFQDLIDDHEKKLATHKAMKAKLEAL